MVESTQDQEYPNDLCGLAKAGGFTGYLKQNEHIIFAIFTKKKNRYGQEQSRKLCLTNKNLYNLGNDEKSKIKRTIDLAKLKGLTKSVVDKDDMIVHEDGEHDYRFKSFDRERIFRHVLDAFKAETGKDLNVFGVRGKMETYMTSQDDLQ